MELINYEDKTMLDTLKNTVCQGATEAEFRMFVEICRSTGLNPFKREIWFIKSKGYTKNNGEVVEGKVQIMTGIMGYLAIANKHPEFDGMECEIERDENKRPVSAVCKVYRKDRKFPSVGEALFSEYYQKGREYKGDYKPTVWDSKPSIMIAKVAKSIALREAFPQELGGTHTEEEMGQEIEVENSNTVAPVSPPDLAPKTEPKPEPTEYSVPDITHDQRLFFEKRGCVYNTETGVWACPINLGPRLEGFRVKEKVAISAPPVEIEIPFDLKPADEIPQETPLEKAKRRAAKMTAEAA